jgi:curli biogenesis system outer membrane secretion channel CsgG
LRKSKELTVSLITELVNMNRFRVVERARIQEILDEQGFQDTQAVNAQAVKIRKVAGHPQNHHGGI